MDVIFFDVNAIDEYLPTRNIIVARDEIGEGSTS